MLTQPRWHKGLCSAVDLEKTVGVKQDDIHYKCWVQDLKSGKVEPITIPSEYRLVDISANDSTLLLTGIIDGVDRAATSSPKAWKPVPIENGESIAMGLSRDGKQAFLLEYFQLKQEESTRYCLCDLKSHVRQYTTLPETVKEINAVAFDRDGKQIVFFHTLREGSTDHVTKTYQVFISHPSGSNSKLIYSSSTHAVVGLDWR